MNKNLNKGVKVFKKGGILIFPTDTAFGIGCRIDNEKAVSKLFKLRNRPEEKAILILASSKKMAFDYVQNISLDAQKIVKKHWPGGITIIFKANKTRVLPNVRAGGETIGIRVPDHKTIRELVRKVGVPILAPSANFSGEKTPYRMSEINPRLIQLVDFVLPGRCKIKKHSTIVDVSGRKMKILRKGAVKI